MSDQPVSVCLAVPFVCLSIDATVWPSIHLPAGLPARPSVRLSVCPSVRPSVRPLSVRPCNTDVVPTADTTPWQVAEKRKSLLDELAIKYQSQSDAHRNQVHELRAAQQARTDQLADQARQLKVRHATRQAAVTLRFGTILN